MEKKFIIYALVFGLLLKAYIGSTARPNRRWAKEHLPALRRNRHENRELQRAFNEYGEDECFFFCIESVDDIACLPERERFWIKELKKVGAAFNINASGTPGMRGKKLSDETRRRQSLAKRGTNHPDNRKDFRFISPDGKLLTPHGLIEFCKENGLSVSAMSKVANQKQNAHRGWKRAIA
jgi:group I intron endonuclease